MLKRVKIKGYKSLVDVDVPLESLSVLFGPNAAGKSNFLDALQLLSRIATARTLKEAFEPPYRGKPLESFTFGEEGLSSLVGKDSASFSIEVDVELSDTIVESVTRQIREMKSGKDGSRGEEGVGDGSAKPQPGVRERSLRYRIELEILPRTGILRVADEYLAPLNRKGEVNKCRKPFLEQMARNRLHLRMEGQAHPTYYERGLDHAVLSMPLYPPHYPHLVAMRQELSRYFFFYFEPRERMRAPNPVKEVRHIGLMGEDLASYLNTLKVLDKRQFEAVGKALHMIVPSVTGIEVGVNALGEVDLWLREGRMRVPARVVSEGTLRVLGLLALSGAKDPPAMVAFEEPENGIHPRRIQMIADLLKTRAQTGETQIIVTTHSSILPDLIADKSLFVCGKKNARTFIEPFVTFGELFRQREISQALDEERLAPSQRILRGDFDA
ncbi:MAG: AAA family ATPase [Pirellulaceae bacterium]|nr:AAA family ATPase [Pirellulaceae bacterium]